MKKAGQIYADAGVDYSKMDPIKILAQKNAKKTAKNLSSFGMHEVGASRGESAYVWEEPSSYRALVVEGLGTKNLVADATRKITGKTYYDQIAQDAVAMIVNDLIVVGALPQVVNAYFAIGDSGWMSDEQRAKDLINGWTAACNAIGATWGGGETPTLKGVIEPETIDLGGAAIGIIKPKSRLVLGDKLADGDAIVLVESSGIHANGITLVRKMVEALPNGYGTKLPDGKLLGETLLKPSHLYVSLVGDLLKAKIDMHYMVNITGHGWRKIMRATKDFTYVLSDIPKPQIEFEFIQKQLGIDSSEMYANFNMGAGFAIYVPEKQAQKVVVAAAKLHLKAWVAGQVKKGPKQVIIEPLDITFAADSLEVR
ncbi:MAG TPA: AIR synthase-related protein [Patescibacteria group bacterium]|nr:AIR synthase-related protein [Patescibacteria group bacterium]